MGKSYIGNIPNTHVRDFQRKRLYQAEESCPFWKPLRFKFLSTKETKTLIKGISNWAEIPIPTLPISRTAPYIAHEMAHVVNYNTSGADHHGPNFTTIYLQVVEKFLGVEAKQELQESFNQNKVRYLI